MKRYICFLFALVFAQISFSANIFWKGSGSGNMADSSSWNREFEDSNANNIFFNTQNEFGALDAFLDSDFNAKLASGKPVANIWFNADLAEKSVNIGKTQKLIIKNGGSLSIGAVSMKQVLVKPLDGKAQLSIGDSEITIQKGGTLLLSNALAMNWLENYIGPKSKFSFKDGAMLPDSIAAINFEGGTFKVATLKTGSQGINMSNFSPAAIGIGNLSNSKAVLKISGGSSDVIETNTFYASNSAVNFKKMSNLIYVPTAKNGITAIKTYLNNPIAVVFGQGLLITIDLRNLNFENGLEYGKTYKFCLFDTTLATHGGITLGGWNMDNSDNLEWILPEGMEIEKKLYFTGSTDVPVSGTGSPGTLKKVWLEVTCNKK